MTFRLIGQKQLQSRLDAIKPNVEMMGSFAIAAVAEQKRLAPRRTGNLGRTIRVGAVSPRYAETVATANYAAYVEFGTRPHDIVPKNRKVLAWPADKGSATLAGKVRKGGRVRFAKRVHHPGTRARSFMVAGAQKALSLLGIKTITDRWDRAG